MATDTASVTINDEATVQANNDTATTSANTPATVSILANDTIDGNPVTPGAPTITTPPAHGTVSWNPATNSFDYTPAPGFCGTDTFEYEIETARRHPLPARQHRHRLRHRRLPALLEVRRRG